MASYLVLARKYRPQGFPDLTGQEHVVQTLSNALLGGRVAHAMLFCGPRGCGKTTTARIVAKALNCERGPTPNPCNVCTACREITAGTDVDVQEIDAASNTGVDNVRELRESAKYLPARDRYKIFIVDEVHMLSKAAFNAFLKTLEEPPGHVKFLFATTDPQALPDTILSRCQRHNFRLVPLKQIVERIRSISAAENVTIDDGAVALVARQAAGSMRDALSILDQLFSSCGAGEPITEALAAQALGALDRNVISDLAGSLLARDSRGVLVGISRAYDGGHDLKRLTEDLATHLRNLIAASISGAPLDLPDHELRSLREQAAGVEVTEITRLFEIVHGALFEMGRAAQPRHALEMALLRAIHLAPSSSVQTLLARADELAKKLGVDPGPPSGRGGGGGGGSPAPRPRANFDAPAAPPPIRVAPIASVEPTPVAVAAPAPRVEIPAPAIAAAPVAMAPVVVAQVVAPPPPKPPEPMPVAVVAPPPKPAEPLPAPIAAIAPPPPVAPPTPKPVAKGPEPKPWERHLSVVPPAPGAELPVREEAPPTMAPEPMVAVVEAPRLREPVSPSQAAFEARWLAAVELVRSRKRMLGSYLEHARPLSLQDGELSLGYVRGEIYGQSVEAERAALEPLLQEALGEPVRLRVVELSREEGARTSSLAENVERTEREAKEARLKGGREHAAILRAAAVLGAEIEDVRDLGGMSA